jgi:HK97 family phage major capsid protein
MIEQLRSLIADALDEREGAQAKVAEILDAIEIEGRAELTPEETEVFDAARAELRTIDERIDALKAQEAEMSELNERNEAAADTRAELAKATPVVHVGQEARTYRQDGEHNFFADAIAMKRDAAAAERIERNRRESQIDYRSTTGVFGGLVVPQYLTELFAPNLESGRPFLSAVTNIGLPEAGMNITIPRGSTSTTVAAQETQNTGVSNTTFAESDLVVPVRTFAGQQVVSRQAVERGTGIASILLADLFSEYATKTNISAISGDGTAGGHFGILNTTSVQTAAWTGTTGASLVSSIHNGIGKVNAARYAAADLIVMHPRRWAWLCAQSDDSGRPLVQIAGYSGDNVVAAGSAAGSGSGIGSHSSGSPPSVVVDVAGDGVTTGWIDGVLGVGGGGEQPRIHRPHPQIAAQNIIVRSCMANSFASQNI